MQVIELNSRWAVVNHSGLVANARGLSSTLRDAFSGLRLIFQLTPNPAVNDSPTYRQSHGNREGRTYHSISIGRTESRP